MLLGTDVGAVIGAFAGSILFVISATDYSLPIKAQRSVVSMIVGVLGSDFVASIITSVTPENVTAALIIFYLLSTPSTVAYWHCA
ncbi:putative holin [Serratia sp. DD3]|uniref:putative holin n=1 Tax=Serratia sp. DD3 TaxID=1410619 RepID=UPI0003F83CD4